MVAVDVIDVILRNKSGKEIPCQILVTFGKAILRCADHSFLRDLAKYDKAQGEDVKYDEKLKIYIQFYKNCSREYIVDKITKEIKKAGGDIIGTSKT